MDYNSISILIVGMLTLGCFYWMKRLMNKPTPGRFYSVDKCVNCDVIMNDRDKMYSNGTCPNCGHTVDGTICETRKEVLKM